MTNSSLAVSKVAQSVAATSSTQNAAAIMPAHQGFEAIRNDARNSYVIGRDKIFEALAKSFIWYQVSQDDADYIERCFKGMPSQINSRTSSKVVVYCLKLDPKKQASTISKYGYGVSKLSKLLGDTIKADTPDNVDTIINELKRHGSIEAFLNDGKKKTPGKKQLSNDEATRIEKDYALTATPELSVTTATPPSANQGDLFVMIARPTTTGFDVIKVFKDDDLIKKVIKSQPNTITI